MGLHLAALAALVGVAAGFCEAVVELSTRVRHRAGNREAEDRIARRARVQAGCLVDRGAQASAGVARVAPHQANVSLAFGAVQAPTPDEITTKGDSGIARAFSFTVGVD